MKLLAIDGNSIINRAFYGIRPLTTKNGEFTNGIYGFMNILLKLLDETNPDGVVVAFDLRAPTFRHKEYAAYKAGRKGMPDELASQLPLLKKLIYLMGYHVLECEGYEADDILGTIAKKGEQSGDECIIATGDRDSFQLISDKTGVRFTSTKMGNPSVEFYNQNRIMEEYELTPKQLIDLKAIEGDKSDNIPGVAGIGKVGALKLIQQFGSLDGVYQNIDSPEMKQAMRDKLIASKKNAYLSLKLGEIFCDVPCVQNISEYRTREISKETLKSFLIRLEFFKIITRLSLDNINAEEVSASTAQNKKFERFNGDILSQIEKTDKVTFLYDENTAYFCFDYLVAKTDHFDFSTLSNYEQKLQVHSYKEIYSDLKSRNCHLNSVKLDASLGAYLINPSAGNYELERLFNEYAVNPSFNFEPESEELSVVKLFLLCEQIENKIKEYNMEKLLSDIEIPLSKVLCEMEEEGFLIDCKGILQFGETIENTILTLESQIYDYAGEAFNINSPKQLSVILFEKLELPSRKKTKSGYSTNAEVLESLRGYHEIIDAILEYRTLTKLKSTYVEGLLKVVSSDGRIHTKFNQTETRTGRISSSEPNLQNIPIRKELGRELRRFFIADEGKTLVDADYSQIELRVLAAISSDNTMIEAFNHNEDIHTLTASEVFNIPPMLINSEMRSRAKAVNFGIVYGIGAFSLAKDIGVSRSEAGKYIDEYLETYSGVARYMDEIIEKAKNGGYVTTIFGRRRYLPELSSSNANLRNFGERVARNMPIQGTAADIIKISMINVYNRLLKEGLKSRLILQVHDELIVEAVDDEAQKVSAILKEEMEKAVDLKVTMLAEVHSGKTWYDAKG